MNTSDFEKGLMGVEHDVSNDDIISVVIRSGKTKTIQTVFGDDIPPLIVSGGYMMVSVITGKNLSVINGIPYLFMDSFALTQRWDSGGSFLDPQDFVLGIEDGTDE